MSPADRAPAVDLPPIGVDCPACGSPAGLLCTSHSGTRERTHDVHGARTAAWEAAQIAAAPAAHLVHAARLDGTVRHGRHAVELLRTGGYGAEADQVDAEVIARAGHLSAKQTVLLLAGLERWAGDDRG